MKIETIVISRNERLGNLKKRIAKAGLIIRTVKGPDKAHKYFMYYAAMLDGKLTLFTSDRTPGGATLEADTYESDERWVEPGFVILVEKGAA
jgi:hypothetical protein